MDSDVALPEPLVAVAPVDVDRVERWAAGRRAELARLNLALRTAVARAEAAERGEGDEPDDPEPLLRVVDATLAAARRDAEEAVEAARVEAATVVKVAAHLAGELLRAAGLDPATAPSIAPRPVDATRALSPTPSARDLWRASGELPRVRPVAVVHEPPAAERGVGGGSQPEASDPVPAAVPVIHLDEARVELPGAPRSEAPAPATRHAARPGEGSDRVYEQFWAEVQTERPLRDRFRRRTAKEHR